MVIDSPPSGSQTAVGEEVFIQSTASDAVGVLRVVLEVDGVLVSSDSSPDPNGQAVFSLLQSWTPQSTGTHTVMVTAFRADGTASQTASISVTVAESMADVQSTIAPPPIIVNLPPTVTTGPCTAYTKTSLNVREGPSISYDILTALPPASQVDVTGISSDRFWWQVVYSGGPGWMSAGSSYSIASGDCSSVPTAQPGDPPPPTPTQDSGGAQPTATTDAGVQYAPSDSDHFWNIPSDPGAYQFTEMISYPGGDTEDNIFFEIDLSGGETRDVQFSLVCTALESSSTFDVRWGMGGQDQDHNNACGDSLSRFFTDVSEQVLLVVKITSGDYAFVQYTLVAVVTN